jgi:putative membrane protein
MAELLTAGDHARLAQAIHEAEANTAGEIYVVVDRAADEFLLVPTLWAALLALLVPWPLYMLTSLSIPTIFVIQAAVFVVASVLFSYAPIRSRMIPAGIADAAVHRNARALFMAHGVHLTAARTGVLIYVCASPRRVEILADEGIHARVGEQGWQAMVATITAEARQGHVAQGLEIAIRGIGRVLEQHFPRAVDDCNELPNRVVEI